jgi:C-terminal processing protease CtpA/Prc
VLAFALCVYIWSQNISIVKQVHPGSAADGRLKVGDVLTAISGESMVGLSHAQHVAMIAKSEQRLVLNIRRAGVL